MCENPFEERYLVIAEKPSVAMTIAAVLGCKDRKDGYMESPDCVVSWCFGHLAEYAMPELYDDRYKNWSLEDLPIIPEKWRLVVKDDKKKQFRILCDLLNNRGKAVSSTGRFTDRPFNYVVNACDAGREGELIFNRVYELSGSSLPVKRLWISSMEDDAIMEGFLSLKDYSDYRNLAEASVCRAQADWLVGINASRAFSKVYNYRLSVGRVQTPTLSMLVERCEQIDRFKKTQYFVTHLLVDDRGKMIDAVSENFADKKEAEQLASACNGKTATVSSLERKAKTAAPPKLYDLTSLQRDANRLLGLTAAKTLNCAQALYEKKLITYPRTDSKYLTDDMERTAADILAACRKVYPFLSPAELTAGYERDQGSAVPQGSAAPDIRRILDSKKVSDHHAIIPTIMITRADLSKCSEEEKKILTLIAARLVSATGRKFVYEAVKATFSCCGYTFVAYGRNIMEEGWKTAESAMRSHLHVEQEETVEADPDEGKKQAAGMVKIQSLSSLYQGKQFLNAKTKVTDHWTKPPAPFTEDSLLAMMERAGANEMEADVERKGLGTPATRAGIIEKLVSSKYVVRRNRQMIATDAGKQLVSAMPEYLKSPQMTADWENRLLQIERGQFDSRSFMDGITQLIRKMLQECGQIDEKERARFDKDKRNTRGMDSRENLGKCPVCGSPVYEGKRSFYCSNRECRFVLWKENKFLERMRTCLDDGMVKDILSTGRTYVRNLYSVKRDKFFSAYLCMEWKDGKSRFRLDFTE